MTEYILQSLKQASYEAIVLLYFLGKMNLTNLDDHISYFEGGPSRFNQLLAERVKGLRIQAT
ncbi:MAG: hypothetical protein MUO26_15625 [Methanotrichaceae archaeon]|nr:hypothetical protein [Methanotrichaceae archaeon]